MPELPEVHNVKLSIEPSMIGKKVVDVNIISEKGIKQQKADVFESRIPNVTINSVDRRGKYLITNVTSGTGQSEHIVVHLGMTGAWLVTKDLESIIPKFKKHVNVVLTLDDGTMLAYSDIRKFGGMRIWTDSEFKDKRVNGALLAMGPEPFWEGAEDIFLKNIKRKTSRNRKDKETGTKYVEYITVKEAVLDQSVVAGIGNIYANECLWYAKVLPQTFVKDLSDEKLREIFRHAKYTMAASIMLGGTSFSDYVNGKGEKGEFEYYLEAYDQKQCSRCKGVMSKEEVAGRPSYFCKTCQH
jgi:formamidopyrimidine-DNA glycosylase